LSNRPPGPPTQLPLGRIVDTTFGTAPTAAPAPTRPAPTLHFIAGLPRSGSTALATLLHQNPRIYGAPISGLSSLIRATIQDWERDPYHAERPDPAAKRRCVRALLTCYHDTDRPILVDKGRGWLALLPALETTLGRRVRAIVTVRPIVDILASFEALRERDPNFLTIVDRELGASSNPANRARHLMGPDGVIGQSLSVMQAAVEGGYRDRLLFVDYDKLTTDPRGQLRRLYAFLDEPYFEHDFGNIEPLGTFDSREHGFVGLHDVHPSWRKSERSAREVLGDPIFAQYAQRAPWDAFT
jgi:sulfotransferase